MTEGSPARRIFISYAREDARDIALRLYDDLKGAGHDAWLDLSEIDAGASWARDIEMAIEGADLVLALLSAGSYVSDICRAEQLRALRKGKRLIPVLVQPDADRPLHLENLNYLDFANPAQYTTALRDLLAYITTGQMPRRALVDARATTTLPAAGAVVTAGAMAHKRDARAFRRYLIDLREESWLGARHWWPYYLFYFADVHEVAAALQVGSLLPPAQAGMNRRTTTRWDHAVRLYFRPRTPDLFACEGVRPARMRGAAHCAVPVYLLFDLEAIINQPDARFTEGDLNKAGKTYKAASAFRDLPFDLIYHDSWFRPDEREEVMTARRAQVIIPRKLPLEHLRHVWCRSAAEYETLRTLLPDSAWQTWQDKVTARADYNLFNRRWLHVLEATLLAGEARLLFNPCDSDRRECGPFILRAEVDVEGEAGPGRSITLDDFTPDGPLVLSLPGLETAYRLRVYLDDALIYAGRYSGGAAVL